MSWPWAHVYQHPHSTGMVAVNRSTPTGDRLFWGRFTAPDQFVVDPIHTRAMFVHKDGHVKVITYWCDVCSIRTYTPGPCWCCQKETLLDLRDPDQGP